MKNILAFSLGLVVLFVIACGPDPTPTPLPTSTPLPTVDMVATETRIAANIFGTQTASAPTATQTFTSSPTPPPTDTATATAPPSETPLPVPTETPQEPTLVPTPDAVGTPVASETIPNGWQVMETDGALFALPPTYIGGDIQQDLPLIIERLKEAGPEFERQAQILEQSPDLIRVWAFETSLGPSGFLTNVNIVREPVASFVTLDIYLQAVSTQMPASIKILETEQLEGGEYPAARLKTESTVSGIVANQILYIVRGPDSIWILTYSTSHDELEERSKEFADSFASFRLLPPE